EGRRGSRCSADHRRRRRRARCGRTRDRPAVQRTAALPGPRAGGHHHRMPDRAAFRRLAVTRLVAHGRHPGGAAARPLSRGAALRLGHRRTDAGGLLVTLTPPMAAPPQTRSASPQARAGSRVQATAGPRAGAYLIDVAIIAVIAAAV